MCNFRRTTCIVQKYGEEKLFPTDITVTNNLHVPFTVLQKAV